jgi:hypothetical protein
MHNLRNLAFHLHRLAWETVQGEALQGSRAPIDPMTSRWAGAPWEEPEENAAARRRSGALHLLEVYTLMSKILRNRTDKVIAAAVEEGATFAEIGAACGMSRQAARQRWHARAQTVNARAARSAAPPARPPDYLDVLYAEAAPPRPRTAVAGPPRKQRVSDVAAELGLESRAVMVRLLEMGEFVRTAHSTLEPAVVAQLKAALAQPEPPGGLPAGP